MLDEAMRESGRGVVWSEVIRALLASWQRQQSLGETDEGGPIEEDFGEAMQLGMRPRTTMSSGHPLNVGPVGAHLG